MAEKKENRSSNEVAARPKCEIAKLDYGDDFGSGFEDTTNDDYSIPFLTILQGLSPQVAGDNALEGAKVGMLFNTVSEEVYDGKTGVLFVPSYRDHCYVEWIPRDKGGGFVSTHALDSEIVQKAKAKATDRKLKTETGNDLIETFYMYGIIAPNIKEDPNPIPVVIAFTSTKIKAYRHLMTKLNQVTVGPKKQRPPIFAHSVLITTCMEKNTKGTYANFRFAPANGTILNSLLSPDDDLFICARGLQGVVKSGVAKINYESQDRTADSDQEDPPF